MYVAPNPYPSQDAVAGAAAAAAAASMTATVQNQQPLSPQDARQDHGVSPASEAARQAAEEAERNRRMVPAVQDADRGHKVDTIG